MRYLLHDPVLAAVSRHPEKIAVSEESGKDISYGELNTLANGFADILQTCKQEPVFRSPCVGILSHVSSGSIAALLGILKTGCAYVPLDDQSPSHRLNAVIDNVKLDTLIADRRLLGRFPDLLENRHIKNIILTGDGPRDLKSPQVKTTDFDRYFEEYQDHIFEPGEKNQVCDDLAYILHSSGSTGIPKGIMLSHRNARTFTDWMQKEFRLTPEDVVISRAPFKFDLSVFDIFNTLAAGARLVCFDWYQERSRLQKHKDYVKLLEKEKVTVLYTTPSTLTTLKNRGGLGEHPHQLRTIMYAGEPFPVPQLRELKEVMQNTRFANIYGPTETNIITCFWIDKISPEQSSIPLGKVVDDTEILVVHEDGGRICEPGETGELWCRGGTVTQGYLGMPEQTKKCLVDSPFHGYPARFWRTGDFGYRDREGLLHYRGRRDHMVKIKGYRIETGEIETALSWISGIHEFAVVATKDSQGKGVLSCFYSTKNNFPVPVSEITETLSNFIPEYMIPAAFYFMEDLPKTSSGKVDRVLLSQKVAKK